VASQKLSKPELLIMNALWDRGALSIREIHESLPEAGRSAYTTIQTTVYRLETKGVLSRTKKIGNAHIFEAAISREAASSRMIDDLLSLFGGRALPMIAQLIETGKITKRELKDAEKLMKKRTKKRPSSSSDIHPL